MASSRREYFRRTRKTRMRDLKNSPTGILSFCTAMAALAVFCTAVIQSWVAYGVGGFKVGGVGFIWFIDPGTWRIDLWNFCSEGAKNQTIAPKTWHCVWRSADRWTWRHVHIRFDVNHDSAQKKHII